MKLSGNTVLITGGASGIGLAMAEAFLALDNRVIICGRDEGRLLDVQRRHPDLHVRVCDLANDESRKGLAGFMIDRFPELNVLVNNAGVQRDIDFTKGADVRSHRQQESEPPELLAHLRSRRGASCSAVRPSADRAEAR